MINIINEISKQMSDFLNESVFHDWKGNKELIFIDKNVGDAEIIYKGQTYNYFKVCESMCISPSSMRKCSAERVISALKRMTPETVLINESRYDYSHIDPITGLPCEKKKRPEDDIELMSRYPARTGWITLFHDRVNINSVGNRRYKVTVWYDAKDHTVSTDRNKEDACHFRTYILPRGGRPGGWMYGEK